MKYPIRRIIIALLLAPLAALHAADAPKPTVKDTQELLNSIHVTPKLIFDTFPAYAQKYLPFAMAASMEVTCKGRLWTCWAGGQDGPNAYLLASYSDDQGKSWRDPVFVIDPQAHGLKMGTRLGSFWCDPQGRLWMLSRGMKEALRSFSDDSGRTWQPQSTAFPHVNSKCVFRRLQSGNILLIRHGQDISKATPARQELTAFLTTDEGKTWSGKLLLDQRTGVSYPDIAQAPGGDIYIHYDRNRSTDAEILFARFRDEDVLAGKLVSEIASLKNIIKSKQGMNRGPCRHAAPAPRK